MSIIHDALKKVQNGKQASADLDSPVSGAPEPLPSRSSSSAVMSREAAPAIPRPILFILMAVVSIVVVVLLVVLIRLARQTTVHPQIITETPPYTVTVSVDGQPASLDSLKLEGIMNMGGKKVALINGTIYEEGQTVEGITILKITETNVTVSENGVDKLLKIKQ